MLSYGFVTMKLRKQKPPLPKFSFCLHLNIALATFIPMITVKTENYNRISQDFYNKTIDSLDLNLISCVCGHSGVSSVMALINVASSLLTGSSPFPLFVCTAKSADIPMHYCFHPWSRIPRSPWPCTSV